MRAICPACGCPVLMISLVFEGEEIGSVVEEHTAVEGKPSTEIVAVPEGVVLKKVCKGSLRPLPISKNLVH